MPKRKRIKPAGPAAALHSDLAVGKTVLAAQLYTTYCEKVGGKALNGDPLPAWEVFAADPEKTLQRDAWIAAAETTFDTLIDPDLASVAGLAPLKARLAKLESEQRLGPGGQGWLHNESKRPEIDEQATFFRALVALVEWALAQSVDQPSTPDDQS